MKGLFGVLGVLVDLKDVKVLDFRLKVFDVLGEVRFVLGVVVKVLDFLLLCLELL